MSTKTALSLRPLQPGLHSPRRHPPCNRSLLPHPTAARRPSAGAVQHTKAFTSSTRRPAPLSTFIAPFLERFKLSSGGDNNNNNNNNGRGNQRQRRRRSPRAQQTRDPMIPRNPLDPITVHRLEAERRAYYMRRFYLSATGMVVCMAITVGIVMTVDIEKMSDKNEGADGGTGTGSGSTDEERAVVVLARAGGGEAADGDDDSGVEMVPTGTSTIPLFPHSVALPLADDEVVSSTDYDLLGLGIRTVSFLGIQVYVVGLYVARDDIPLLQRALVRTINPVATTLIPAERDQLRSMLLDPDASERVWNAVLRGHGDDADRIKGLRMAIRIVPTRNTDFQHLRDGWVRGITTRTQHASASGSAAAARRAQVAQGQGQGQASSPSSSSSPPPPTQMQSPTQSLSQGQGQEAFDDEAFGTAMQHFKSMFSSGGGARKSVPKGKTLLLLRDGSGRLSVWYDDRAQQGVEGEGKTRKNSERKEAGMVRIGDVGDERVSRLIWLNYLAGRNVASEGARKSVVDGLMELVERPVGSIVA